MDRTDNLPLRDLQKILLGKRKEPLSPIEIRNLFSYPTTPESILYIITALNKKKIDPNTTLIQAIANATKKEDLVPVALSIRYGADPNLYVNAPNIGNIHILGYVYLVLKNNDTALLNAVVIMLMASGADPHLPIFDSKGGAIKDEFSLLDPIRGQSVTEWLYSQGIDTIVPLIKNQNYDKVDKRYMTTIATFLDRDDLLQLDPRLDEVIGAHAIKILEKHEGKANRDIGLRTSKDYLNLTSYEKFVDAGAYLNYAEVNDMILSLKAYKDLGDIISAGQVRQMLLYSISRGEILDKDQLDMIEKIDETTYNRVVKAYSIPYWQKVCKTAKGSVPDKLKLLAYRLNLYPEYPKGVLCNQIQKISQADPETVKKSAIERQRTRIRSDVAFINQFSDNKPPVINCSNRSVLKTNIYDYPDVDIAYYMDDQESLWCFNSVNFVKILERGKNPYTNQPFPDFFLERVQKQKEFIERYRSIDETPATISETVDSLVLPDTFDNEYSEKYVKRFEEMMIMNGVSEWNIKKLTKEDLQQILSNNLNINTSLVSLSRSHAVKTFYIVSYTELTRSPELIDDFFKQIETKSINNNNQII